MLVNRTSLIDRVLYTLICACMAAADSPKPTCSSMYATAVTKHCLKRRLCASARRSSALRVSTQEPSRGQQKTAPEGLREFTPELPTPATQPREASLSGSAGTRSRRALRTRKGLAPRAGNGMRRAHARARAWRVLDDGPTDVSRAGAAAASPCSGCRGCRGCGPHTGTAPALRAAWSREASALHGVWPRTLIGPSSKPDEGKTRGTPCFTPRNVWNAPGAAHRT